MVALPFCSLTLTAKKPSKTPQNPKTIGDHIKKRRLELGLLQKDVAQILGVNESTVTNWEKTRTEPQLYLIPKLIEFLGFDPSVRNTDTLGGKLLRYRKCRGVTQKQLAKQIGIDPATLGTLERNQTECFNSVLEKATAFLDKHASKSDDLK